MKSQNGFIKMNLIKELTGERKVLCQWLEIKDNAVIHTSLQLSTKCQWLIVLELVLTFSSLFNKWSTVSPLDTHVVLSEMKTHISIFNNMV